MLAYALQLTRPTRYFEMFVPNKYIKDNYMWTKRRNKMSRDASTSRDQGEHVITTKPQWRAHRRTLTKCAFVGPRSLYWILATSCRLRVFVSRPNCTVASSLMDSAIAGGGYFFAASTSIKPLIAWGRFMASLSFNVCVWSGIPDIVQPELCTMKQCMSLWFLNGMAQLTDTLFPGALHLEDPHSLYLTLDAYPNDR